MQPLLLLADASAGPATTLEWIIRSEGWFLWIQVPMALVMLTLILSAFDLTRKRVVMPQRLRRLLDQSPGKDAPDSVTSDALAASNAPLARVVRAGFEACRRGQSRAEAGASLDRALEGVALGMERRLTWINTLAHVALSTGLLGTVCGLVNSFTVIARGGDAPAPHELAAGVSMALVTTIFGLFTAIPGLLAHGVLQPRSNRLLHELEETSHRALEAYPGSACGCEEPLVAEPVRQEA
jgi:biopolymer transport protein ExbB